MQVRIIPAALATELRPRESSRSHTVVIRRNSLTFASHNGEQGADMGDKGGKKDKEKGKQQQLKKQKQEEERKQDKNRPRTP
jgi:hypothetical protein